jgi:Mrp family chromosome partitioning ATPase
VDLAFRSPNLSVISTDPNAPGIAELAQGTASFGDIITRDQYSRVHLIATGNVGNDAATLPSSPMVATTIEALAHSYEHVVIDMGSASDVAAERFVPLAAHAMLVAADPASAVTRTVRDRLLQAGFSDVTVVAGGAQAVAA